MGVTPEGGRCVCVCVFPRQCKWCGLECWNRFSANVQYLPQFGVSVCCIGSGPRVETLEVIAKVTKESSNKGKEWGCG